MRVPVRHRLLAASLLVLAVLAGRTGVADVGPPRPAPLRIEPRLVIPGPGVLRAGQEIVLRWSGGEREGEELEIMLTLESPARRTLQISPHLDPARGVFVWRVPELGRATGRFRVRFERDGHEVEGTPSALYEILSGIAPPLSPALLPDATLPGAPAGSPARAARTPDAERAEARLSRAARLPRVTTPARSAPVSFAVGAPDCRDPRTPVFVPARN